MYLESGIITRDDTPAVTILELLLKEQTYKEHIFNVIYCIDVKLKLAERLDFS